MENVSPSPVDRFNSWVKESVMLKLLSIGFLILILLIPASWITSLIEERESRADEVIREISDKWSGTQTVTGPVLMIPFTQIEKTKRWEKGVEIEERTEYVHRAFFLPEELKVDGKISPEILHRGIFDAVVYESKINMKARFGKLSFEKWNIPDNQVHWKEAALVTGLSDLRGISENPVIHSGEIALAPEPSSDIGLTDASTGSTEVVKGITTPLNWSGRDAIAQEFTMVLQLKGSELLYFIPVGKTTDVKLTGNWPAPSFDGKLLPSSRQVTENDFLATWKVLSYNRPFSQQWLNNEQSLGGSEFGVRLVIPADQYQKSIRTSKYGVLIIILAFTALFLVEITARIRIHPFQYILIGAALIIYYTLLLSFSEHMGYNIAYVIASIATTLLVVLYATSFLKQKALVALFGLLMTIFYTFIFVIIQAQDFSLLIGSVGLFLIIAVIMYFSRNIRWYRDAEEVKQV